jgi:hypothetical protein
MAPRLSRRPGAVRTFHVREWLAEAIGCMPDDLTILELTPDIEPLDIIFARRGQPYGQVHLMQPAFEPGTPFGERALIAAWRGGQSAREALGPGTVVDW